MLSFKGTGKSFSMNAKGVNREGQRCGQVPDPKSLEIHVKAFGLYPPIFSELINGFISSTTHPAFLAEFCIFGLFHFSYYSPTHSCPLLLHYP